MGSSQGPAGSDLEISGIEDAQQIGSGGFGTVYRARQPALNRMVAVKVLRDGIADDLVRQRFEREIRAMGLLGSHPNIVTIYGHGLTDTGHPYILMDYLPRGSLAQATATDGPLAWQQVLDAGVQLCGALETAHQAGVLHRDLKPENMLLSQFGDPQLGDFGIARLDDAPHTRTGTLTASIAHCAPELLDGAAPSVASDIYALASTFYMLLTGTPAFTRSEDQSLVNVFVRITSEPVPDLRVLGVPDSVCAVIEQAMDKGPDRRPPSAQDLGGLLQHAQREAGLPVTVMKIAGDRAEAVRATASPPAGEPATAHLQRSSPPTGTAVAASGSARRSPVVLVGAGLIALLLVVGGGVALLSSEEDAPADVVSGPEGTESSAATVAPAGPAGTPAAAQLTVRDLAGAWALDAAIGPPDFAGLVPCGAVPAPDRGEDLEHFRGGRPGPTLVSAIGVFSDAGAELSAPLERLRDCAEVSSVRSLDLGQEALLAVSDLVGPPAHQHVLVLVRQGATLGAIRLAGFPVADEAMALELAGDLAVRLGLAGP